MVKVKDDLTGLIFGRLTVIQQAEDYVNSNGTRIAAWWCKCDCGNSELQRKRGDDLKSGKTKSCGCLLRETAKQMGSGGTKENKKDLSGEFGIIWLTNTNEECYFDLEDADIILQHCWYQTAKGYPATEINRDTIKMHQLLGYYGGDHINRNKLDNRKSNLRPCTQQENCRNRSKQSNNKSGFIGVYWDKYYNKWVAQIKNNQKTIKLGSFTNKNDAVIARLKAEKDIYRDFAPQRHLFEEYNI